MGDGQPAQPNSHDVTRAPQLEIKEPEEPVEEKYDIIYQSNTKLSFDRTLGSYYAQVMCAHLVASP